MQDRKRLEEQIDQDVKIRAMISDVDTLFELAKEGEDTSADIAREIRGLSGHL